MAGRLFAEVRLDFLSTFDASIFADSSVADHRDVPTAARRRKVSRSGDRMSRYAARGGVGGDFVDIESDVIDSAGSFGSAKIVAHRTMISRSSPRISMRWSGV
jgi:hypothetical protein